MASRAPGREGHVRAEFYTSKKSRFHQHSPLLCWGRPPCAVHAGILDAESDQRNQELRNQDFVLTSYRATCAQTGYETQVYVAHAALDATPGRSQTGITTSLRSFVSASGLGFTKIRASSETWMDMVPLRGLYRRA